MSILPAAHCDTLCIALHTVSKVVVSWRHCSSDLILLSLHKTLSQAQGIDVIGTHSCLPQPRLYFSLDVFGL